MSVDQSAEFVCEDARGAEGWTCREYDGTGLWCDACLAWAAEHSDGKVCAD